MPNEFTKYTKRGAYHWDMISRNPRKHHPFVVARYKICLDLLGSVKSKKILDLGCGDGALSSLIAISGGNVIGVDASDLGVELARNQFEQHRLKGEFYSSTNNFPDSCFDAIVCTEVIEHVKKPDEILQEIQRIIKPKGVIVITTPIRLTEHVLDKEHIHEYFESDFLELCSRHFEIVEMRKALPAGLHEILYIDGVIGRVTNIALRIFSSWFGWNYLLRIKGKFRLYEIQAAKLRPK